MTRWDLCTGRSRRSGLIQSHRDGLDAEAGARERLESAGRRDDDAHHCDKLGRCRSEGSSVL